MEPPITSSAEDLLALVAMEPPITSSAEDVRNRKVPITSSAEDVRNRKVEVLRSITPLKLSDLVIGQYQANPALGQVGYLDDRTVPEGSITPTYAMAVKAPSHLHTPWLW
ncbi:hypothetical protein T484DRAFT_1820078 [Baffinella frigidus]|nr:hypothetical protein T484DRAFT_1820078 [Cryptophyta sp. CCMP2293]